MKIACSTWNGGGNVAVFKALGDRLRARGHKVSLQIDHRLLPETRADVLLVDHMTSNAGLQAAIDSGVPTAAIVHTLWSFVPSLEGTFAKPGYLDLLGRLDRLLVFTVEALDGSTTVPANLRFVGPVLEPEGPDGGWRPPERSLVVVSMGTTPMDEGPVLQRILDALEPVPVDVVATLGEHLDPSSFRVPANAKLLQYVRHSALLPHADLFIGHAGHGGIMAAMAFGVPMVLLPLDRDQPFNAARVEAVGAGRALSKDASPEAIRAAVEAVRTGERERSGAIEMANAIASYGDAAVREIEALEP